MKFNMLHCCISKYSIRNFWYTYMSVVALCIVEFQQSKRLSAPPHRPTKCKVFLKGANSLCMQGKDAMLEEKLFPLPTGDGNTRKWSLTAICIGAACYFIAEILHNKEFELHVYCNVAIIIVIFNIVMKNNVAFRYAWYIMHKYQHYCTIIVLKCKYFYLAKLESTERGFFFVSLSLNSF